jgi:hypothetical protein
VKRIAVILAVLAGCHRDGVQAVADSGPQGAAPAAVDAGFALTAELLDAYLRYHKASAALQPSPDGGMMDRAARDEAALKQTGLSDGQVLRIDEMVASVVARRTVTQLAANPEFMPDIAAMGQALNAEQKQRMDEAMAAFKQQQQQAKELTDERKRFGTQNIDVLLTREAEVTKAWSDMMGLTPLPGR